MGHIGDYQSVFQLSAALSFALFAVEAFLESPVAKMSQKFHILLYQTSKTLSRSEAPKFSDCKDDLTMLHEEISTSISSDFSENAKFINCCTKMVKVISVVWATGSCLLLIYSSDKYGSNLLGWEYLLSYLFLAIPLGLTILMLSISAGIEERLESKRQSLEARLIQLTDKAWGLAKADENPGKS